MKVPISHVFDLRSIGLLCTAFTGVSLNVFTRRATAFHMWAKLLGLKFFVREVSSRLSNQPGKIVLTARHFARCLAYNETPVFIFAVPYESMCTVNFRK